MRKETERRPEKLYVPSGRRADFVDIWCPELGSLEIFLRKKIKQADRGESVMAWFKNGVLPNWGTLLVSNTDDFRELVLEANRLCGMEMDDPMVDQMLSNKKREAERSENADMVGGRLCYGIRFEIIKTEEGEKLSYLPFFVRANDRWSEIG